MAEKIAESDFERPSEIWTYRARANPYSGHDFGIVDGDTYDLVVDLGFRMLSTQRVRAQHINTAETYGVSRDSTEYQVGMEQMQFTREWIRDAAEYAQLTDDVPSEWPLLVRTERRTGKYGRWLASIYDWRGHSLEAAIVDEFGEEYLSESG